MAESRQTTGAVHITELDVGISKAIESLKTFQTQFDETVAAVNATQFNPIEIPASTTTNFTKELQEQGAEIESAQKKLESYINQFSNLKNKVQLSNLSADIKASLIDQIDSAIKSIENLQQTIDTNMKLPANISLEYDELQKKAKELANSLSQAKKEQQEFSKLSTGIERTVKQLDSLQTKAGKFGDSRQQIATLRQEYQNLAESIKNGNISTEDARAKFDSLGKELDTLSTKVKNGDGLVNSFLSSLADKAKWAVVFQMTNMLQQAFSNVIGTMKDTEDAVIEIQRVLNDSSLGDSEVAQRLYDIASNYGQTFENVQEVFLRFAQSGLDFEESTKATEAAMLGLNTAELEVETATQGLIAIMAQFGYTADDLTDIIDKINITADNFPVTSEKIVSALQRAGGTAKAFGISLEETIATITALSEATGRSGENIGTALNSLIIFTSKTDNLKLFSGLSNEMDEIVRKFQSGTGSIIDLWTQLSKEIEGLSAQQAEALFNSEAFEEFADDFEAEAAEYAASIQQIYGTAGAYRRNYLTAILNDIGTVEDALKTMAGSEGYSLSENEKAMDRLTAKWNQLVVAAQQLAVQFGEAGFLDLLKWLAEATTSALKFSKELGGLKVALIAVSGILLNLKSAKIAEMFAGWVNGVKEWATNLKNTVTGVQQYTVAVETATVETAAFQATAQGVISIFGLLVTAISSAVAMYNAYKSAQEQARQEAIQEGHDAAQEADNLYTLYSAYLTAQEAYDGTATASNNLKTASDNLLSALKQEGIDVSNLTGDYEGLTEAVNELIKARLTDKLVEEKEAIKNAEDSIKDFTTGIFGTMKMFKSFDRDADGNIQTYKTMFFTVDQLADEYDRLSGILAEMRADQGPDVVYDDTYQAIKKVVDEYEPYITALRNANDEYDRTENQLNNVANGTVELGEAVEKASGSLYDSTGNIVNLEEHLETLTEKYSEVESRISDFQSAYGTLISVIDEYNNTGIMTSDMLQQLLELEPEYLELLEVKADQLSLNKDGVDALIDSTETYMQQLVALRIAEEAEQLATELQAAATANLTLEEYKAQVATLVFGDEIYNAALNMIQGTGTAEEFAAAVSKVGQAAELSGEYLGYFSQRVGEIFGTYSKLLGTTRGLSLPSSSYKPSSGGSGSSASKKAADDTKKALQSEIKAYQEHEKELKAQYKEEEDLIKESAKEKIDAIKDELDEKKRLWKHEIEDLRDTLKEKKRIWDHEIDNLKETLEAEKRLRDNEIDALKDRLSAQKEYYNNLKKSTEAYYDGLIENLRDVQEENDRINAQLDYYQSRQKIITNIEQAQSRSGVEWREKEMEYQQQLIDLDEDWRRKQEGWALDDQIAAIEKQKEAAIAAIEAEFDAIEKSINAEIERIEDLRDAFEDSINDQIDAIKKEQKAYEELTEDKIDAIEKERTAFEETSSDRIKIIEDERDAQVKALEAMLKAETDEIDAVIKGLQAQVDELSSSTASSTASGIKSGFAQGATFAGQSMADILANWKRMMDDISGTTENSVRATAKTWEDTIKSTSEYMENKLPISAEQAAKNAYANYQKNFFTPVKTEIDQIMAKMQKTGSFMEALKQQTHEALRDGTQLANNLTNNVNLTNYINNTSTANTVVNGTISRLNSFK